MLPNQCTVGIHIKYRGSVWTVLAVLGVITAHDVWVYIRDAFGNEQSVLASEITPASEEEAATLWIQHDVRRMSGRSNGR